MPFANAGIVIASASGSEVEFTNGDQPGVRLAKTAALHSRPTARASVAAESASQGKTPKATEKKR